MTLKLNDIAAEIADKFDNVIIYIYTCQECNCEFLLSETIEILSCPSCGYEKLIEVAVGDV